MEVSADVETHPPARQPPRRGRCGCTAAAVDRGGGRRCHITADQRGAMAGGGGSADGADDSRFFAAGCAPGRERTSSTTRWSGGWSGSRRRAWSRLATLAALAHVGLNGMLAGCWLPLLVLRRLGPVVVWPGAAMTWSPGLAAPDPSGHGRSGWSRAGWGAGDASLQVTCCGGLVGSCTRCAGGPLRTTARGRAGMGR